MFNLSRYDYLEYLTELSIGVDVQAYGNILDDLNALGVAASDGQFIVATSAGVFAYESGNTARTSLGLGTGDSPTLTGLTLSGLVASRIICTDGDKALLDIELVNWIGGTANQITVTNDTFGGVDLSLPASVILTDLSVTGDTSCDELTLTLGVYSDIHFGARVNGSFYTEMQTAAKTMLYEMFTQDGDGTDYVGINMWFYGEPDQMTNRQIFQILAISGEMKINSQAAGDQSVCPMILYTGANTDQLKLDTGGEVYMAQAVDDALSNLRDTYWDSTTGQIGYDSSSHRYKDNIVDVNNSDTAFIHLLRTRKYNKTGGFNNEIGLIAEEVAAIAGHIPNLISYHREPIMGKRPSSIVEGEQEDCIVGYETTTDPETVNYSRLIVPLLAEIQKFEKRISKLEAK